MLKRIALFAAIFAIALALQIMALPTSTAAATTGTWYHLVGVRDVLNDEVKLHVNGKLESTVKYGDDWPAKGHTVIGAARQKTHRVQFFAGKIDDVRLINGALRVTEV